MSTALAVIETITAIDFFKPGASATIIDKVITESMDVAAGFDVSTPAGEAGLRSLAAKLGKVKNRLDEEGKALVAGKKAEIKLVDTERSVVWDRLEAAQKEIKAPVLAKEQVEKDRIANHEARIAAIAQSGTDTAQNWQTLPMEEMEARFSALQTVNHNWQEFAERAKTVGYQAFIEIKDAIAKRRQYDKDQQDLVELRAAQAKREVEEREARIAQESREAAEAVARQREEERRAAAEEERLRIETERAEAEARAKQAEALRVAAEERAAREAEEAAERHAKAIQTEQERSERERQAAELRAKLALEAEQERAADALRVANQRAKIAAEKAEAERVAAVEAERQRAADEQRKAQEEAIARESNRKHAAKINNEVVQALIAATVENGLGDAHEQVSEDTAKVIVAAIAKGLIPHTKINY